MCYQLEVVSLHWRHGDLGGKKTTIRVTCGGEETSLSVLRPYGMEVPPNEALDESRNLLLIIDYLQHEHGGLEI